MECKLFISVMLLFIISFSFVDAAVKEGDKNAVLAQIEMYKNEPAKLTLVLAVVDSTMDLTDEPELKQKIVETAGAAGLDINQFQNIAKGTVPYVLQEKQIEATTTTLAGEQIKSGEIQQGDLPGANVQGGLQQVGQDQAAPGTQQGQLEPSQYPWSMIVLLLGIVVILVLIGWWYGKRKAK